jgi:predicted transcriptional regulator
VTRPWKAVEAGRLSPAARARVKARVEEQLDELTLAGLRRARDVTQVELSRAADMTQSELSRIEARADHLTSTLRRYVEALGGELEISVKIDGKRIRLRDA